ncbi:uncharacterized protein LOC141841150 [Curcuma longa]|uniref:uncharacterized protein LOC141841150 n=1 Tax=Curcuma longa TaxID=136217 RepID=UPI003D9E0A23
MASHHPCSKNEKASNKHRWLQLDVHPCRPNSKFHHKAASKAHTKGCAHCETRPSIQGASTSKFLSVVSTFWEYVENPAVLHKDEDLKICDFFQKENITCGSDQRRSKPAGSRIANLTNRLESKISSASPLTSFEKLKNIKKQLTFPSYKGYADNPFVWKHASLAGYHPLLDYDKVLRRVTSTVQDNPCENIYDKSAVDNLKVVNRSISTSRKVPFQVSAIDAKRNDATDGVYDPHDKSTNVIGKDLQTLVSLYTTDSLKQMKIIKETIVGFRKHDSYRHFVYNFDFVTLTDCKHDQCQQALSVTSSFAENSGELRTSKDCNIHKSYSSSSPDLLFEGQCSQNNSFKLQDKLQMALMKNKHAIAGALAGTTVSLCLHPIDTIKTIIQADGISQKSIYCTFRKIILEKGIQGLYRGIATNIASSAPISAIYTFTYESVKGGLLPILPKEYHSISHCFAGACSSLATSVVFTPSERIKQQMQVGLQYQNCWNAFIACLERGGMLSLYAGWTAVLCRNIPHSIIKFYTYESLKQSFLNSTKPVSGLNTSQTLLCGGIAGCTAALFTTPFDVIKTKLQTQVPGTRGKYNGVFHALQEITKQEGLQGLHRGLTPRLAIYMSQGAIFFASYEFLKSIFDMTAKSPVQTIHNKQNANCSTSSEMSKLHS